MNYFFGLVVFILDVWAISQVFRSGATTGQKAFWIILILILPIIGFIAWYFAGPKATT